MNYTRNEMVIPVNKDRAASACLLFRLQPRYGRPVGLCLCVFSSKRPLSDPCVFIVSLRLIMELFYCLDKPDL